MIEKARRVLEEQRALEEEMSLPETVADNARFRELGRRYARLGPAAQAARSYLQWADERSEWEEATRSDDADFAQEARREVSRLESQREELEKSLRFALIPKDPADDGSCVLEIRAGTGGDEAALFAGDLVRMYLRYFEGLGWKASLTDASEGTAGGFKEAILQVDAPGAFGRMRFESGVHRVQRVPATEAQGRVHTSAATVAVMPETDDEIEIRIDPSDLRVDTYRAQGAGGQHVNKTESAVRLTHIPTGMVAACQSERSQIQNRETAMRMLKAKLLDHERNQRRQAEDSIRRDAVGTGDRSDKIRTYNFPQNRLTDHRIGLTLYRLDSVMQGDIAEVLDALRLADSLSRLEAQARS
ncbi:MAG TPA: peptide chain release factor 1 [Fibrobacteria bacterium]|nr:peptide chain release factor 1 [Fibrobacteria bacterium]HOX51781.1 peptide chain release factor 1 [Fibrobacteria bacterium]